MNAVSHQTLENPQQYVQDTVSAIASEVFREVSGRVKIKTLTKLHSIILIKAGILFQHYTQENADTFITGVRGETIACRYFILFSFYCYLYIHTSTSELNVNQPIDCCC